MPQSFLWPSMVPRGSRIELSPTSPTPKPSIYLSRYCLSSSPSQRHPFRDVRCGRWALPRPAALRRPRCGRRCQARVAVPSPSPEEESLPRESRLRREARHFRRERRWPRGSVSRGGLQNRRCWPPPTPGTVFLLFHGPTIFKIFAPCTLSCWGFYIRHWYWKPWIPNFLNGHVVFTRVV